MQSCAELDGTFGRLARGENGFGTKSVKSSNLAQQAVRQTSLENSDPIKLLIRKVYQEHNPKLEHIDELLARYKGREEQLYKAICAKYGVVPNVPTQSTSALLAQPNSGPQPIADTRLAARPLQVEGSPMGKSSTASPKGLPQPASKTQAKRKAKGMAKKKLRGGRSVDSCTLGENCNVDPSGNWGSAGRSQSLPGQPQAFELKHCRPQIGGLERTSSSKFSLTLAEEEEAENAFGMMQEEDEENIIILARKAEQGGKEDLMNIISLMSRMKNEACIDPTAIASLVSEEWLTRLGCKKALAKLKPTLRHYASLAKSHQRIEEHNSFMALIRALDGLVVKQEEQQSMAAMPDGFGTPTMKGSGPAFEERRREEAAVRLQAAQRGHVARKNAHEKRVQLRIRQQVVPAPGVFDEGNDDGVPFSHEAFLEDIESRILRFKQFEAKKLGGEDAKRLQGGIDEAFAKRILSSREKNEEKKTHIVRSNTWDGITLVEESEKPVKVSCIGGKGNGIEQTDSSSRDAGNGVKASFSIGERVMRRNRGQEWGRGYVSSTRPLKVTVEDHPETNAFSWDEVRKVASASEEEVGGLGFLKHDPSRGMLSGEEKMPLSIRVLNATGLSNPNILKGEKSDPYCAIEVQDGRGTLAKTTVKWNTRNPQWNEDFILEDYVVGQTIVFQVWDKDVFNQDDYLGKAMVSSSMFLKPGVSDVLDLKLTEVAKGMDATLKVKISARRQAVEAKKFVEDDVEDDVGSFDILEQEKETLSISVLSASGLRRADQGGRGASDPYCTVEIKHGNGPLAKTTVKRNTINPQWNEDLILEDYVVGQTIVFKVWDKDFKKQDDYLGTAMMTSNMFLKPGGSGVRDLKLSEAGTGVDASLKVKIIARSAKLTEEHESVKRVADVIPSPMTGILIDELEAARRETAEAKTSGEEELKILRSEAEEAFNKASTLKEDLDAARRDFHEEARMLRSKAEHASKAAANMKEKLFVARREVTEAKQYGELETNRLRSEVAVVFKKAADLKDELDNARREAAQTKKSLEEEARTLRTRGDEASKMVARLKLELDAARKHAAEAKKSGQEEAKRLRREAQEAANEAATLKQELVAAKKEAAEAKNSGQEEVRRVLSIADEASAKVADLEDQLIDGTREAEKAKRSWEEMAKGLRSEVYEAAIEAASLKLELDAARKHAADVNKSRQDEANWLRREAQEAAKEAATLKQELAAARRGAATAKSGEAEEEAKRLRSEAAQASHRALNLQDQLDVTRKKSDEEANMLRRVADEAAKMAEALKEELYAVRRELMDTKKSAYVETQRLRSEPDETSNMAATLKEELDAARSTVTKINKPAEEVWKLRSKSDEASNQVASLKEALDAVRREAKVWN